MVERAWRERENSVSSHGTPRHCRPQPRHVAQVSSKLFESSPVLVELKHIDGGNSLARSPAQLLASSQPRRRDGDSESDNIDQVRRGLLAIAASQSIARLLYPHSPNWRLRCRPFRLACELRLLSLQSCVDPHTLTRARSSRVQGFSKHPARDDEREGETNGQVNMSSTSSPPSASSLVCPTSSL